MSLNKLMDPAIGKAIGFRIGAEQVEAEQILIEGKNIGKPSYGCVYSSASVQTIMLNQDQYYTISKQGVLVSKQGAVDEKKTLGDTRGLQVADPGVWRLTANITISADVATALTVKFAHGSMAGDPHALWQILSADAINSSSITLSDIVVVPEGADASTAWYEIQTIHYAGAGITVRANITNWTMSLSWISELP